MYSLHVLDKAGLLQLSYFFQQAAVEQQDQWEATLESQTKTLWNNSFHGDIPLFVEDRPVLVRGVADMVFLLTGDRDGSELALREEMEMLLEMITAACDRRLMAQQVASFHGKIVVCLDEMYRSGERVLSEAEAVLRHAKLKAVAS